MRRIDGQLRALRACVLVSLLGSAGCGGNGTTPTSPDAASTSIPSVPAGWLATSGHQIVTSDGRAWQGRGVNIQDTRSCDACTWQAPNVDEVKRRIDEAVGVWGATFLRLTLESYASSEGRVQWRGVLDDPAYLADVREIVRYIGTKPGVYVLVSLWEDPTFDDHGWPTAQTAAVWARLADTFKNDQNVLFGVANEPESNFDGAQDAQVQAAMNDVVAAIRGVEDAAGTPYHLVAVQGTRQWARVLDYYVTHPIAAGSGRNVVYETHVYDPASEFAQLFVNPARTLPVIIGEFGPIDWPGVATMSLDDCAQLMSQADQAGVPYLAWTFHMRCSPNLLQDASNFGCGVGMPLSPTSWGTLIRQHLAQR